MDRRSFLKMLGIGAAGACVAPGVAILAREGAPKRAVLYDYMLGDGGSVFRYVLAVRAIRKNTIVNDADSGLLGFAHADIRAGNYGWIQTAGPCQVGVSPH